jgi:hypothetical protein
MIHGYMATFGAYGSWFPNDPRGSRSKFVGSRALYLQGGPATSRESLPYERLDIDQRQLLNSLTHSLQRPRVVFNEAQVERIGQAICQFVSVACRIVWALAVLPWHTHLVFARGQVSSEDFVQHLKSFVHDSLDHDDLLSQGCDRDSSVWAVGQWIDYLDSDVAIEDAINYTNANLTEVGLALQHWECVTPFQGIRPNVIKYWD